MLSNWKITVCTVCTDLISRLEQLADHRPDVGNLAAVDVLEEDGHHLTGNVRNLQLLLRRLEEALVGEHGRKNLKCKKKFVIRG